MAKIEWLNQPGYIGETWNPIVGCSPIAAGCRNCWAARFASRGMLPEHRGLAIAGEWTGKVRCLPDRLDEPLYWKKPRAVAVALMSDLFHKNVPDKFRQAVFGVMSLCGQHRFLILTKRPNLAYEWFCRDSLSTCQAEVCVREKLLRSLEKRPPRDTRFINGSHRHGEGNLWPLPNVWFGCSASKQEEINQLHYDLPAAAVRFWSLEPLLGPINCDRAWAQSAIPNWVIIGGESGPGARPCNPAWIRSIVRQCQAAGVPVFVKQLGTKAVRTDQCPQPFLDRKGGDPDEWPEDLRVRQFPENKEP
jgi:protein gp37